MKTRTRTKTLTMAAKRYEDHDDCLAAAEAEVKKRYGLEGWNLDARWSDNQRDTILLTVPLYIPT